MFRTIALVVGLIALLLPLAGAQEVLITDFPLGVGGTIGRDFFEPYYPQLQALADTLHASPQARAVIVGGADGFRYVTDNDAKNPGLSLGRAHALRNVLVHEFRVDSTQLLIQSADVHARGGRYRCVSVRIEREPTEAETHHDTLAQPPIVERPVTEIREITNYIAENMGLRFGAGVSSSPFGGIPMVAGGVTWKRIVFVEGVVGHTFWSNAHRFEDADLATWHRMAGGRVTVYPFPRTPVGVVGGWVRIEEISQTYYEYVQLSEGPVMGLEATPFRYASVTGLYNPARLRIAGDRVSRSKSDQFLIAITLHMGLGGAK